MCIRDRNTSDEKIVRIYPEGNSAVIYNNLKGGKAIVTATYKGKTYSCNVVSYSSVSYTHLYVKTIVAFANTQGGKLIVGVDDKNHQVIGVENDILFQTMDAIATAVSDSCMPQIIPDIEPQTVEGKTIIIVSVEAGKNRPYYLQ